MSTLTICNQSGSAVTYRVAVRPTSAVLASAHYLAFDAVLAANDMQALTIGISLGATDAVTVYGSTAALSFSLFGCEVT